MSAPCPDCGAVFDQDDTCQSVFDSLLVLEFTDPAYGEVHMLTVACFMIQHRRYSDEALVWIEQQLRAHLERDVPVGQIRKHAAQEARQDKRAWKVTRRPGEKPLPPIAWSMTIADVAQGYQDAASYRDLVKQWAKATLKEMRPYLS
jgi:hypothetical protein